MAFEFACQRKVHVWSDELDQKVQVSRFEARDSVLMPKIADYPEVFHPESARVVTEILATQCPSPVELFLNRFYPRRKALRALARWIARASPKETLRSRFHFHLVATLRTFQR